MQYLIDINIGRTCETYYIYYISIVQRNNVIEFAIAL